MVRLASPEDLPAIVDIYNEAVDDRFATADLRPVTVSDRKPWFDAHDPSLVSDLRLRRPGRGSRLVLAQFVSIGTGGRSRNRRDLVLRRSRVAQSWRRHGPRAVGRAERVATRQARAVRDSSRAKSGEHPSDAEMRLRAVGAAAGRGVDRRRAREPFVLRPTGVEVGRRRHRSRRRSAQPLISAGRLATNTS